MSLSDVPPSVGDDFAVVADRFGDLLSLERLDLCLRPRVNGVPLLILLPQVVVALDWLLLLKQIPDQGLGGDPLLGR